MRRVVWEIDVDQARTPLDAALQAFRAMQTPDTIATVFKVIDQDGTVEEVDLAAMSASNRRTRRAEDPLAIAPTYYLLKVEPGAVSLMGPYSDEIQRLQARCEATGAGDARWYDLDASAFDVFVAHSDT